MKNNKPAKKAAPKTAKKVEKKAVAAKKVAPSKTTSKPALVKKPVPQKPNPEVSKITKEFDVFKRQALNEIEDYKMTVGQLEAAIDDLKQKNAKLRKRLNAKKEEKPVAPVNKLMSVAAPSPLGNVSVPMPSFRPAEPAPIKPADRPIPASPFAAAPAVASVIPSKNKRCFCSPVSAPTSPFLKNAKATRY